MSNSEELLERHMEKYAKDFERFFTPAIVAKIAQKHTIEDDKVPALKQALAYASTAFVLNEGVYANVGIGRTGDAVDLETTLKRVCTILDRPGVVARLEMSIPRPDIESGKWWDHAPSEVRKFRQSVESFIGFARTASSIDGRPLNKYARERNEIRYAAAELHRFWTKELGKPPSVQNRGGLHTPALDFLLDCLRHLDPRVKEASFRGFEDCLEFTEAQGEPKVGGVGQVVS